MDAFRFIKTFPEPTAINPKYLADLGSEFWRVSWRDKNKKVVFESGSYKAVIMPLNLE